MGTFRVSVTVSNFTEPGRRATLPLLVDTGATYTVLPRDVIDALGARIVGTRRVRLASGHDEEWPVATVLLTLEGQELPTIALVGPPAGLALLGAVTLEEFALGVDPHGRRLVPVTGYLMAAAL